MSSNCYVCVLVLLILLHTTNTTNTAAYASSYCYSCEYYVSVLILLYMRLIYMCVCVLVLLYTVCLDDLSDAAVRRVLRGCAHAFCHVCLDRLLQDAEALKRERAGGSTLASAKCPMCRLGFTAADVFSAAEYAAYAEMANGSSRSKAGSDGAGGGEHAPGAAEAVGVSEEAAFMQHAVQLNNLTLNTVNSTNCAAVGAGDEEGGGRGEGGVGAAAEQAIELASVCDSVSPKILALVADLEEAIEANGRGGGGGGGGEGGAACGSAGEVRAPVRAVVFSQFIGCLDQVALALARSPLNLRFARLQGNMSLEQRRSVLAVSQWPNLLLI